LPVYRAGRQKNEELIGGSNGCPDRVWNVVAPVNIPIISKDMHSGNGIEAFAKSYRKPFVRRRVTQEQTIDPALGGRVAAAP
jgi:hypothetical protein